MVLLGSTSRGVGLSTKVSTCYISLSSALVALHIVQCVKALFTNEVITVCLHLAEHSLAPFLPSKL